MFFDHRLNHGKTLQKSVRRTRGRSYRDEKADSEQRRREINGENERILTVFMIREKKKMMKKKNTSKPSLCRIENDSAAVSWTRIGSRVEQASLTAEEALAKEQSNSDARRTEEAQLKRFIHKEIGQKISTSQSFKETKENG